MRKNPDCIARLEGVGISSNDAWALRRISMTLRRWFELECGTDTGAIERDEKTGKPAWVVQGDYGWSVWCLDDKPVGVEPGELVRATKRTFPTEAAASDYAAGVSAARMPVVRAVTSQSFPCADREAGAMRRLRRIMARYPALSFYIQGDCRGASLYILRPGDVPAGKHAESYYTNGISVYR